MRPIHRNQIELPKGFHRLREKGEAHIPEFGLHRIFMSLYPILSPWASPETGHCPVHPPPPLQRDNPDPHPRNITDAVKPARFEVTLRGALNCRSRRPSSHRFGLRAQGVIERLRDPSSILKLGEPANPVPLINDSPPSFLSPVKKDFISVSTAR